MLWHLALEAGSAAERDGLPPGNANASRMVVCLILLSLLGCTDKERPDAGTTVRTADPPPMAEPSFRLIAPVGFVWNEGHGIYYNDAIRTSISLTLAMSVDFQSVVDDFTPERMLDAKLELLSKEIRAIDGRPTLLVKANRLNAPCPQRSLTAAFAARSGCAQVTAIYPATTTPEIESEIEEALVTSRYVEP
jgi:hypothetical protein